MPLSQRRLDEFVSDAQQFRKPLTEQPRYAELAMLPFGVLFSEHSAGNLDLGGWYIRCKCHSHTAAQGSVTVFLTGTVN